MGWNGIEWDGMGWNGMEWDGMGWNGMEWDGMGWNGMGWDSQRILLTKFLRLPDYMKFGIVCMNDEMTPNGFGMDSGWILDGFWMDSGWILDGSWMDFGENSRIDCTICSIWRVVLNNFLFGKISIT
jgi:hypothetical protein